MMESSCTPFARFAPEISPRTPLRDAITRATRRAEPDCLPPLIALATQPDDRAAAIRATATSLIERLRAKRAAGGVEALVQEYDLSSQEGVALMCLAEALLRIPDNATRDALIRDKIADGDWSAHLGFDRPLFVNAATWGLVVTGKLSASVSETGLGAALTRLVARAGEPVIRRGVDLAMRLMGEQFVTGETIAQALDRAKAMEARGFAFSYDMLGEGAVTSADADRYFNDYEQAIHAIGRASAGRGIIAGPGISIKLSALHPRYSRAQAGRVMAELLPKVRALALLAKGYDIGFNIDAEEADRLELSLDLLDALAGDAELAGWNGLGFVVQAYGKRCPFVIDWIIDCARRTGRRIMVRLVKGAYWDAEIKRAQVDGLADFPVYTRKTHTDVAYIACAAKLLEARDAIFPQFATHNAQTLATVLHMAGPGFTPGDYEFQCLHGMGEPLYDEVVGPQKLNRPCRVYAPVGTHETLLAYLVRRLLENGANSSFVNRIADPAVPVDDLVEDPVALALQVSPPGRPHDGIALPPMLYGERANSRGLDLSDVSALADLDATMRASAAQSWVAGAGHTATAPHAILNPADHRDVVGHARNSTPDDVTAAMALAAASAWGQNTVAERAACLTRAADMMQDQMATLIGLIIREAGKSAANAVTEVREAIDFLRYYTDQALAIADANTRPLGPVVAISPWNFPLAIFTGQIAAALVCGNPTLAKPAEETPLVAAQAVAILHSAGVPADALHLIIGDGSIGAALVASPQVRGVLFTGSTEVARLIQGQLAERLLHNGRPIPLIAETGGQNAMIVDSTALPEQVVADVIASAFDSAGQRCSALRILCLQEDIADRTLAMLKGALAELTVGNPDRLATDIGPVISAGAKSMITAHIARMQAAGMRITQWPLSEACAHGHFVPPTIIELDSIERLTAEVFGPVLHVVRYRRDALDSIIDSINATGYGLTFGLHTRIDETVAHVTSRIKAGNLYINRNVIGAVVGVQPFGGRGLSGTGPKAGGPMYLSRLILDAAAIDTSPSSHPAKANLDALADWLDREGEDVLARSTRALISRSPLGHEHMLPGPVGESNGYAVHPRGTILSLPVTRQGLLWHVAMATATGNRLAAECDARLFAALNSAPDAVRNSVSLHAGEAISAALIEGEGDAVTDALRALSRRPGPLIVAQSATSAECKAGTGYSCRWLVEERVVSINTTAAGGNASLMMLG